MGSASNWHAEGLPEWRVVARRHARPRPCPPLNLHGRLNRHIVKAAIQEALGGISGSTPISFVDYSGMVVSQTADYFGNKLLGLRRRGNEQRVDVGHAVYVGWIAETLLNPIEVWDRRDKPTDPELKRHYYSAYTDATGAILSYMAIAVAANGTFITAFQKASSIAIDARRDGIPLYRCYPK